MSADAPNGNGKLREQLQKALERTDSIGAKALYRTLSFALLTACVGLLTWIANDRDGKLTRVDERVGTIERTIVGFVGTENLASVKIKDHEGRLGRLESRVFSIPLPPPAASDSP